MKKISSRNYLVGLRVHLLPFAVWLGTVAVVVTLFSHRSSRYEILGIAQAPVHQVAAMRDGRLQTLNVELFDEVAGGQVLAVVDAVLETSRRGPKLQARLDTLQAQMGELVAQAAAARAEYLAQVDNRRSGWAANKRSFAANVAAAELRALELEMTIERDEFALREMQLDIDAFIAQGQLDVNDLAIFQLQKLKASYATLEKTIEQNKRLKDQADIALQDARDRQEQFVKENQPEVGLPDEAADDLIAKQKEVIQRQRDEVMVELKTLDARESLELRAPFDGVVSLVERQPGEVVLAGEPILTIAKGEPDNIVAYATEEQAGRVKKNMEVRLINRNSTDKTGRRTLEVTSRVIYVGPTVEQLPPRLWRNPNMPQWGRPILIDIPSHPDWKLIPGAVVGIKLI